MELKYQKKQNTQLEELKEKWNKKYPQILKSWDANWTELSTYFMYPQEVRTVIYTTYSAEGFHRMLRKFTKIKTVFPTDDAVKKSVYLSTQEISKNGVCLYGMRYHNSTINDFL